MRLSTVSLHTLLLFVALSVSMLAQPTGPSQPINLVHADSLVFRQGPEGMVQEAWGNVRFTQGAVVITADKAVHYEGANRAVLTGRVHVVQPPGTTLDAPRAEYDGNSKIATAPSGVTIVDNGATIQANYGQYDMAQRHAIFRGGVRLRDERATLRAGAGDYYMVERRAVFRENVEVRTDSGTITSRHLTYWRDTQETFATGSVVLTPKNRSSRLTGDTMRHYPASGYSVVTGAPRLVDIDIATGGKRDTTVITSTKMESFRGAREEYVATGQVKLRRSDLQAVAPIARFLPAADVIALGSGRRTSNSIPTPPRDTGAVTGDTPPPAPSGADTNYGEFPIVWYGDSQLTGDTITVGLADKRLRSIDAVGDAFAVSRGEQPERYNQFAAVRLLVTVLQDTVRRVRAEGDASYIYFVNNDKTPNGLDRSSADTITIDFKNGNASRMKLVKGRVALEGDYFPEALVVGSETRFRLQGFRWYDRDRSVASLKGTVPKAPTIEDVR